MSKSKVYSSPTKRSRRLNVKVIPKLDKYIAKRPYPPGQHGQSRHRRPSDYSIQLQEKQRAKFIYGIREAQFKKIFELASKTNTQTGIKLLQLLELRFDNVVYRGGFARSRKHARQLINHGHFILNNKKVSIPSVTLNKGDIIRPKSIENLDLIETELPIWISNDQKKKTIEIKIIPSREDIPMEIDEQLIIEFYSR